MSVNWNTIGSIDWFINQVVRGVTPFLLVPVPVITAGSKSICCLLGWRKVPIVNKCLGPFCSISTPRTRIRRITQTYTLPFVLFFLSPRPVAGGLESRNKPCDRQVTWDSWNVFKNIVLECCKVVWIYKISDVPVLIIRWSFFVCSFRGLCRGARKRCTSQFLVCLFCTGDGTVVTQTHPQREKHKPATQNFSLPQKGN